MSVAMIGPKFYAWDRNGKPLAFGKLYTYLARTNTPKDTYQSEDGVVANTNPVILNGEGYANVYLDGSYKVVLKDSDDNEIWSADPVTESNPTEWIDCLPATYLSASSFKVNGNFTAEYEPIRRVRINNNVAEFAYSTIISSSYAGGETTVVISDPVVTTGIIDTCVSIVGPESTSKEGTVKFFDDLDSAKSSLLIKSGEVLNIKDPTDGKVGSYNWDVVDINSVTLREDDIVACTGQADLALKRRNPSGNESYQTSEQLTKYTMSPNRHIFGEEYLWGFHKQVVDSGNNNNNKFIWSGDSTTAGDNAGSYTPDFIGTLVSGDLGLALHEHINAGHSGDAATDWDSTWVSQDIANHPDMNVYVARWGINDGSLHGNVQTYINAMDSALGKLRAFKSVTDLAIVVVSPNSTYDPFLGRDENWYEQIVPELRKICRKHQATFIDIYSIWQDSRQGGGKWYDQPNTGGGPAPIHPDATFALQIGVRITEMIVAPVMYGQNFAINKLQSTDPDQFRPNQSTSASSFTRGISLWTVRASDGWISNGKLRATRNGTKVIQELFVTEDDGTQTQEHGTLKYVRFADSDLNVWSKWYNLAVAPTVGGGWSVTAGRTPKYVHSEDGSCTLMGTVGGGVDGTTIFTLPEEMRPSSPRTFIVATDGVAGSIVILTNGDVQPYMNGGTFINFDGVVWSAIN